MDVILEGWEPTPLEKSLMDGTFDKMAEEIDISDMPQDLMEVQPIEEALEDIKQEIESSKEFDEIYSDFGKDDDPHSDETISAEEFHREWHRIVEEIYNEMKK